VRAVYAFPHSAVVGAVLKLFPIHSLNGLPSHTSVAANCVLGRVRDCVPAADCDVGAELLDA
jgi:hypothetical protein